MPTYENSSSTFVYAEYVRNKYKTRCEYGIVRWYTLTHGQEVQHFMHPLKITAYANVLLLIVRHMLDVVAAGKLCIRYGTLAPTYGDV